MPRKAEKPVGNNRIHAAAVAIIFLSVSLLSPESVVAGEQGAALPKDYLVGIYYFAGWWQKSPNKWESGGQDWRPDYPERVPLLGEYNDQPTMDREITAASCHGVDFFQILWYPNGGLLNEGLRNFTASTNALRMKFTLEFVNHPPFALTNDADWEAACRQWCMAMKHPRATCDSTGDRCSKSMAWTTFSTKTAMSRNRSTSGLTSCGGWQERMAFPIP